MASADVSVIIPYFNAIETIQKSISSVLNQTFSVREIIVIDDCSSDHDELVSLLRCFNSVVPIMLERLDINSGPSESRNRAIEKATGKYIAFLDADDVWHPDKIAIQYNFMKKKKLASLDISILQI